MLVCGKNIENRKWRSSFRGRVLVHASKTWDEEGAEYLRKMGLDVPDDLPRGAYVGEFTVTDCIPVEEADSVWAFGPWCYLVKDPVAWEVPVPGRGHLGFYEVDKVSGNLSPS
jgi:hypothetical protein